MQMTRKIKVMMLVLFTSLLVFSSCSGLAKQRKITFLTHPTLLHTMADGELIKEFTKATGIEVEVTTMPIPQIREKLAIEFMAKTARYDVISISTEGIFNSFVAANLEPLDKYNRKSPLEDTQDIIPSLIDDFRYPANGPMLAIPFRTGTTLLIYRKDLLDKYRLDVPKTWDELQAAAKKLTLDQDGDGKPDIYGFAIEGGDVLAATSDFIRVLYANGGSLLDDSLQKVTLMGKGLQTLEAQLGFINDKSVSPDYMSCLRDDLIVGMQQGRVAMVMSYSPYFSRMIDPKESTVADVIGASPVPTAPGVSAGRTMNITWAFGIDKNSRNKEEGWELIKWLSNKKNQELMAFQYGNGPVRTSIYQDSEYIKFNPAAEAILVGLSAGKALPPHPRYAEMEQALGEELLQAYMHQKTPEKALQAAEKKLTEIINR